MSMLKHKKPRGAEIFKNNLVIIMLLRVSSLREWKKHKYHICMGIFCSQFLQRFPSFLIEPWHETRDRFGSKRQLMDDDEWDAELQAPWEVGAWNHDLCSAFKGHSPTILKGHNPIWPLVATQIFLEFSSRNLGKMNPFWRSYFSNGLKPPTSHDFNGP